MIDQKRLRELVKLMVDNELTELDLQDEAEHVSLKRTQRETRVQDVAVAVPPAPVAPTPPPADAAPVAQDEGLITIHSPMVGTFYIAASPDADPFVKVRDPVDQETVVCVIEAMKVFNEIKAETRGNIEKILVQNGQAIEFGQPLFLVRSD